MKVELYGCESNPRNTVKITDVPAPVYNTAGIYYNDQYNIVLCGGGVQQSDGLIGFTNKCYTYK